MALNFPSTPSNGQIYTSGNDSWVYNSTLGKWLAYKNDPHILSATPPTNDDGTLWYDTETGLLFVRYGGVWVEPAGYSLPTNILRDTDIGVRVEAYDATIYDTSDVGVTIARPTILQNMENAFGHTSLDFTNIPSWATLIEVYYSNVSSNGSSNFQCQIGDSGGIETSGYLGAATGLYAAATVTVTSTTGCVVRGQSASDANHGVFRWVLHDASTFTWVGVQEGIVTPGGPGTTFSGVSKSLSAALDRVRFTTVNGTDIFDSGQINVRYS